MATLVRPVAAMGIQRELALSARTLAGLGRDVGEVVVTYKPNVDQKELQCSAEIPALRLDALYGVAGEMLLPCACTRSRDSDIASSAVKAIEAHFSAEQIDRPRTTPKGALALCISGGWVTLRGTLEWSYQRTAAEQIVRSIPGVCGVSNLISITRPVPVVARA